MATFAAVAAAADHLGTGIAVGQEASQEPERAQELACPYPLLELDCPYQ